MGLLFRSFVGSGLWPETPLPCGQVFEVYSV